MTQTPPERIRELVKREIAAVGAIDAPTGGDWRVRVLPEFESALVEPEPVLVEFVGARQTCWAVTKSNGRYRVVYVPSADYFALVVDLKFGAVDISVHGPALGCFGSV